MLKFGNVYDTKAFCVTFNYLLHQCFKHSMVEWWTTTTKTLHTSKFNLTKCAQFITCGTIWHFASIQAQWLLLLVLLLLLCCYSFLYTVYLYIYVYLFLSFFCLFHFKSKQRRRLLYANAKWICASFVCKHTCNEISVAWVFRSLSFFHSAHVVSLFVSATLFRCFVIELKLAFNQITTLTINITF